MKKPSVALTDANEAIDAITGLVETGIHRIFTMNQAPVTSATVAHPLLSMLHLVPSCMYLRKSVLQVGDKGTSFRVMGMDHSVVTQDDYKGRPLVIRFTRAANSKLICPGCTPGLHDLNETYGRFAQHGLELLVVMPAPIDQVRDLVEVMGLNYPVYTDATWKIFMDYGMQHGSTLPSQGWAILDADGILRWVWRSKQRENNVWKYNVPMPEAVIDMAGTVLRNRSRE